MRKTSLVVLMIVGLGLYGGRLAAADDIKIGVVDFQKVLDQSTLIRELNTQLEEKIRAEEEIITKRKESLQEKKGAFEKQQAMLDADVRAEKEEKLRQELKDLQRYANDKQEELQRKGSELMQRVVKELNEIVSGIGEDEAYTAIVERSTAGVVYFNEGIDITERVMKEYEKRNKK